MRLFIDEKNAAAGPFALEQPWKSFLRSVSPRNALGIGLVVMNPDDIGCHALPAIVSNHRTRGVKRFGQVIHRLHPMPLRGTVGQIGYSPGFVKWDPGDNAGVTRISVDRLLPLARQPLYRFPRKSIGARHFFPDQKSQSISPVEISRILDLLVLTSAIEPHI